MVISIVGGTLFTALAWKVVPVLRQHTLGGEIALLTCKFFPNSTPEQAAMLPPFPCPASLRSVNLLEP